MFFLNYITSTLSGICCFITRLLLGQEKPTNLPDPLCETEGRFLSLEKMASEVPTEAVSSLALL